MGRPKSYMRKNRVIRRRFLKWLLRWKNDLVVTVSREIRTSRTLHGGPICVKKNVRKIFIFWKKNFVKIFYFFLFFSLRHFRLRVENLSFGWRAGETRFLVKICVFGGQNCTSKRGFFVQNRDFSKLRSQLSADTIPPIYIVFKMPPKMAPRTCLGVRQNPPASWRVFSCFFCVFSCARVFSCACLVRSLH